MEYDSLSKQQLLKIIESIRSPRYGHTGANQSELVGILEAVLLERFELEAEIQTLRDSQALTEKSLQEYISLFEAAPVPYVVLDTNACVLKMNQLACELVQTDSSALAGLRFSGLLTEAASRQFLDHFTECRRFKNAVKSVFLVLKAGNAGTRIMMTGSCSDVYRGVLSPLSDLA